MSKNFSRQTPVAIIGMGCIFAKSPDLKSYLRLLIGGIDGISDPPDSHAHLRAFYDPDPKRVDHIYCNRGGFLPYTDFDPTEFGMPPNALEATDTSQLLGLLTAKKALEDAGYGLSGKAFDRQRTSVILGVTGTQELVIPLGARLSHPLWRQALENADVPAETADKVVRCIADGYVQWQENSFPGLLGNVVAGRIANKLDLGGTNCVVDAACASSMAALNLALLELQAGRSDMVISGGVDTINDPFMYMCFAKTHILSASGDVRPFSQQADGTILGEGVGLIVIKRLEDAQRDKDRIYAVIRGIGAGSDGKNQSIYAPSPAGQAHALRRAYENAGIDPAKVGLIEAHGTGTRVGDEVEFQALRQIFSSAAANQCALGSVKSNIGHTKAAAGTAGLMKATLALYHKILPPTLKAASIDSKLDITHSPFYINHTVRPWLPPKDAKRYAGVSAFGFGGSNFHVVLEEYESAKSRIAWDGRVEIVAFCAESNQSVAEQLNQWQQTAEKDNNSNLYSAMAAESRGRFDSRQAKRLVMVLPGPIDIALIRQYHDAAHALIARPGERMPALADKIFWGENAPAGGLAFLFPGQGSQYVGMGRHITCHFPDSLGIITEAAACIDTDAPLDDCLYPRISGDQLASEAQLRKTDIAQPAIGAVSAAMLAALRLFNIKPDYTCGHSYGELTALYAAGCLSQNDFWKLSHARGKLMAAACRNDEDCGSMLAVSAPLTDLNEIILPLSEDLVIANYNAPDQGVLSGSTAAIDNAERICRQRNWRSKRLPVAGAFHSRFMTPALSGFRSFLEQLDLQPGNMPVMSNTLGDAYPHDRIEISHILGKQLSHPVQFISNIEKLYEYGIRTYVEVGPGAVLTGLVKSILKQRPFAAIALDRSAGRKNGLLDFAACLSELAAGGYPVDFKLWEEPVHPPASPLRMRIPINGANYRLPRTTTPPIKNSASIVASKMQTPSSSEAFKPTTNESTSHPLKALTSIPVTDAVQKQSNKDMKHHPSDERIKHILATVQQGIASMQALQAQTTQAHQRFLEVQAEANRALTAMIQSAGHLGTASGPNLFTQSKDLLSTSSGPVPDHRLSSQSLTTASSETSILPTHPITHNPAESTGAIVIGNPLQPVSPSTRTALSDHIQSSVTAIVAELTGYPEQMLGMDMDIESDLGIDSIKRVEILSAVEEKMPDLPRVTPDMLGDLKTLGHICNFLAGGIDRPSPENTLDRPNQATPARSAIEAVPARVNHCGQQEIQSAVTAIVAELTGYPEQMLGMDMDIESDLGIDSIKRVEILSAVEEKMPDLPRVTPDMLGDLKTLGQICNFLAGGTVGLSATTEPEADSSKPSQCLEEQPGRFIVAPETLPPINSYANLPYEKTALKIFIVAEQTSFSELLAQQLINKGYQAQVMPAEESAQPESLIAGLILVSPIRPKDAFKWAHTWGSALCKGAEQGHAFFFSVSFLDGAFGFNTGDIEDPLQGALAGLVKTASLEWPTVHCRALDIDPHWKDIEQVTQAIAAEIMQKNPSESVELGLSAGKRLGLNLVPSRIAESLPLAIGPGDVVVVTGGARGITATAAKALALQTRCGLALLGRSAEPQSEPDWLCGLSQAADVKKAILAHGLAGQDATPMVLEKAFRFWMANREIVQTMTQMKAAGIDARYLSVDVRRSSAVMQALALIRVELGPIRGLIHGAGVLEDHLLLDKTVEQFEHVFDTKVDGFKSLMQATAEDDLRYIIIFSSISGRLGNIGQSDYAMANEALNKMSCWQARQKPHCKVVSINWGPWDGGMVGNGLKRYFSNQGISLITPEQGAMAMIAEMAASVHTSTEVIIGGLFKDVRPAASAEYETHLLRMVSESGGVMNLAAERQIDLSRYPVLQSHYLDGRPVVPLALIAEWLAQSALHANPGLLLYGIDQLRLFKGISLESHKKNISLMTSAPQRNGSLFEVNVEIHDSGGQVKQTIHSCATAILADRLPAPPKFEENGHFKPMSAIKSPEEYYRNVLFHGDALKGLKKIIRISDQGMTAIIDSAPEPKKWINDPWRNYWILDPLVLDCAFQMAIIWCYEQLGQLSLPNYVNCYRQYCDRFPGDGITAVLEVEKTTPHKMTGRFTFLDDKKQIVAKLEGFEAIMDSNLFKAFGVNATGSTADKGPNPLSDQIFT